MPDRPTRPAGGPSAAVFVCGLLCGLLAAAGCDRPGGGAAGGDPFRHDLGAVPTVPGEPAEVSRTFVIPADRFGDGAEPVVRESSCGCASAEVAPRPGGGHAVTVRAGLPAYAADWSVSVAVGPPPDRPGAAASEPVWLALHARPRPPVRYAVGEPVLAVRPGERRPADVVVFTHRPAGLADGPVTLESSSPLFRVVGRMEEADYPEGAVRTRRTRFLCEALGPGADGAAWGGAAEAVTLTARHGAAAAETRCLLEAVLPITADPPRVVFAGADGAGPGAVRRLTLRADRPFRVLSVAPGDACTVEPTVGGGEPPRAARVHEFLIRRRPGGGAGGGLSATRSELTFRTDRPDQPTVPVPVTALHLGGR